MIFVNFVAFVQLLKNLWQFIITYVMGVSGRHRAKCRWNGDFLRKTGANLAFDPDNEVFIDNDVNKLPSREYRRGLLSRIRKTSHLVR